MCTTYTLALGQFYQNERPTSGNPEVYYHIVQTSGMKQNDTLLPISWQVTDNMAGNGPDLGDVVLASGLGEEDPASEEEAALLERATFQG